MRAFKLKNWASVFATFLLVFAIFATKTSAAEISAADLSPAARHTLVLIKQGGPFPYHKDGAVFGNYEGVLPKQKRGYYHEFTVPTAASRGRGAARIVAGGKPGGAQEYFFTDNHYATFARIRE